MPRDIQQPVTVPNDSPHRKDETITTHPAYAQLSVSRVTGHTNLFDSDFSHNAFMVIRVAACELHRNLSSDWHYPDHRPMIEIALSEAQWATFVSSPNMAGVPATLQSFNGEQVPQLPPPASRVDQFSAEMKRDAADTVAACRELDELIDSLGLPKGKAEQLRAKSRTIAAKVSSSMPFVADQFEEHMENVIEKGKAELHGYMGGVLQRAGLTALTGGALPLALEDQA